MRETEFLTLMHNGMYVNPNLLENGIYISEKPFIYSKNQTIELMVETAKNMKDLSGVNFITDKYFDNLMKCELVPIIIELKTEL